MKFLCALAALAVVSAASGLAEPQVVRRHDDVVHVSLDMPTKEQRARGARPSGFIPLQLGAPGARMTPPVYHGPRQPQSALAGRISNATTYIYHGKSASLGQFPWMLGMFMDDSYFCGASIISEEWVLTAGHCVDGVKTFQITAGSLYSRNGPEPSRQVVSATEKYRHPQYNSEFIDNDIGIVKPSTKFVFGDYVRPVRLPSYTMAMDMMVGSTVTLSGWGKTSDNGGVAATLNYADFVINDGTACTNNYGNAWIPNKICIDTSKDLVSSCSGDSGGPLVLKEDDGAYTELGLTSFGAAVSCQQGLAIAFTRVPSFLEFIETTTNIAVRD